MRNRVANTNQFCVSAYGYEPSLNTAPTDNADYIRMLVSQEDICKLEYRREDNSDEATGYEEASEVFDLGQLASMNINFKRGKPQHFAFLCSYALGVDTPQSEGTQAGFYSHFITNIAGFMDANRSNPTFCLRQQLGGIVKQRFMGCHVKSLKVALAKDSWATISATIGATGKVESNVVRLILTAAANSTALTLTDGTTLYKLAGTGTADKPDSVDVIRFGPSTAVRNTFLTCTNVTTGAGTAADIVLFANSQTSTASRYWQVIFIKNDTALTNTWGNFPSTVSEPPLRTTDFLVTMAGLSFSGNIAGGKTCQGEVKSFEWNYSNEGMNAEFVPGGQSGYATRVMRQNRKQTITFNRDFMDNLLQQLVTDNEIIAIKAQASLTTAAGETYRVIFNFPRCQIMKPDIGVDGKLLSEATEIAVLEGDAVLGSVTVQVDNKVAAYCQA